MSVNAKEFDKHKNPMKYIIAFLRDNTEKGFTASAIAKEIGINPKEVEQALYWEILAMVMDKTYRSHIDRATIGGVTYYKYKE